jgi:tight adherence protein B
MSPIILIVGGGILLLVMLVIGIVVSVTSEKAVVEERIGRYVDQEQAQARPTGPRTSPLTEWLNKKVEKSSFGDGIAKDLARADVKLKTGEYIALIVISAIAVGGLAYYISGFNVVVAPIGLIIGVFIPNFYVKGQQSKRLQKFDEQLGDMLSLMVNGLRAGFSTMQAMEAVSKELPPPICDEFRRVVQEMQLGVNMETALANLLRRIPSEDLDLVVTAINVQREVGGNLTDILDSISFTIRERVRIKGEIRVLTTQVAYSGKMLSLLPIIVMGILYLLNKEYMMEFFVPANNQLFGGLPCGYIGLGCGGLLILAGYMVMNKIGEVEI